MNKLEMTRRIELLRLVKELVANALDPLEILEHMSYPATQKGAIEWWEWEQSARTAHEGTISSSV